MRASPRLAFLVSALAFAANGHAQEGSAAGAREHAHFDTSTWTSLFDGRSLAGWTTKGGRYDGKAVWAVENGAMVGREGPKKAGGLIYTEGYYQAYLLSFDCFIDYPFDSGVFINMVPRARRRGARGKRAAAAAAAAGGLAALGTETAPQRPGPTPGGKGLQVTLDYRPGGEVGGIYADGWLHHCKGGNAKWKRGKWNRVELRCAGLPPRVEVWLNGEKLTDYELPRDAKGYAPSGRIGLQVHGARGEGERTVRFRKIKIRELPVFDRAEFDVDERGMLKPKDGTSWESLLAGKVADHWELHGMKEGDAVIKDGVLSIPKRGGGGHILTKQDFKDFEFRVDFALEKMANSGVFLRSSRKGNPAYTGCEIQILDDHNWEAVTKNKLKDYQFTGGLYGALGPKQGVLHAIGRWNTMRIRYVGSRIHCELNGRLLYDVDTHSLVPKQGPPFAKRLASGAIGLQRHAKALLRFRNVFVKQL